MKDRKALNAALAMLLINKSLLRQHALTKTINYELLNVITAIRKASDSTNKTTKVDVPLSEPAGR